MPEYIWELVCSSELQDGRYSFPEGTVVINNGFMGWEAIDSEVEGE